MRVDRDTVFMGISRSSLAMQGSLAGCITIHSGLVDRCTACLFQLFMDDHMDNCSQRFTDTKVKCSSLQKIAELLN